MIMVIKIALDSGIRPYWLHLHRIIIYADLRIFHQILTEIPLRYDMTSGSRNDIITDHKHVNKPFVFVVPVIKKNPPRSTTHPVRFCSHPKRAWSQTVSYLFLYLPSFQDFFSTRQFVPFLLNNNYHSQNDI